MYASLDFGGYISVFLRDIIIPKNANESLLENRNIYITFLIVKNYGFNIENAQNAQNAQK